MVVSTKVILILLLSSLSQAVYAMGAEEIRLRGFAEHQSDNAQFEKARQQGERAFYEEADQWQSQRERNRELYKHEKKASAMSDEGVEARADAAEKKARAVEYDKSRIAYVEKKSQEENLSREDKHLPTEVQELGLDMERPRYDYRRRAAFGAKPKYGSNSSGGSSSSGSGFGGGTGFPPPPTFDDFGAGGGYVPAPNLPEDFGDVPPPPPPPPPPGFGDDTFGGGYGNDFAPPPPPPPPFGDDGQF